MKFNFCVVFQKCIFWDFHILFYLTLFLWSLVLVLRSYTGKFLKTFPPLFSCGNLIGGYKNYLLLPTSELYYLRLKFLLLRTYSLWYFKPKSIKKEIGWCNKTFIYIYRATVKIWQKQLFNFLVWSVLRRRFSTISFKGSIIARE